MLTYTYDDMQRAYNEGYSRAMGEEPSEFLDFMFKHYPTDVENQYRLNYQVIDNPDICTETILAYDMEEAAAKAFKHLAAKRITILAYSVTEVN